MNCDHVESMKNEKIGRHKEGTRVRRKIIALSQVVVIIGYSTFETFFFIFFCNESVHRTRVMYAIAFSLKKCISSRERIRMKTVLSFCNLTQSFLFASFVKRPI